MKPSPKDLTNHHAFPFKPGARVLFANFPADGHFNPLTGLAVHLKRLGYDVRWYTSATYADKLKKLSIPHYPFKTALDIGGKNPEEVFPQRAHYKSQVSKLKFDIIHLFVLRAPEYYADIRAIHKSFPFDVMVADVAFTAIPLVKEHLKIPVVSIGVVPLAETSRDLPPMGLGLTPARSFMGKLKQSFLRFFADQVIFKQPYQVLKTVLGRYGVAPEGNVFDTLIRKSTLLLQSGTPGFEYHRSDLSPNIRYIGPLLPHQKLKAEKWFDDRLLTYEKVILVTQGTVENDVDKLIVPTLEAYQNTDRLVVVTTGGAGTEALRKRFPAPNIIIEDFIPFADVMPYAHVYVTNGGYGGVLLSIQNKVPLVVGGIHEGKIEINARVGYFGLGVNMKTEKPTPEQVKKSVEKVLHDKVYKSHVTRLSEEFNRYHPEEIFTRYIEEILVSRPEKALPAVAQRAQLA